MKKHKHYYDKKYPLLYYADGGMYSIPPILLIKLYQAYFHQKPKSFFDCGAACGGIVQMALDCGIDAHGVEIKKYHQLKSAYLIGFNQHRMDGRKELFHKVLFPDERLEKLFENGNIEIKSILDCSPIQADLAYFNGILSYFDEDTLSEVLAKFQNVKMLCAIHNTTEDYAKAQKYGNSLGTCQHLKTVRSNDWWIKTFNQNGFKAQYHRQLHCFIAINSAC